MGRWIARVTRRGDEGLEVRIRVGLRIVIRIGCWNRRLRPPERLVVLRLEHRDHRVEQRDVQERERAGVLAERSLLRDGDLLGHRIPGRKSEDCRVEARHVGAIGRPVRAVDRTDGLHFVEVPARTFQLVSAWRRIRSELIAALDAEGRDVPHVQQGACLGRAAGRELPFAWIRRGRHVELRRLRTVVHALVDHRGRCGLADPRCPRPSTARPEFCASELALAASSVATCSGTYCSSTP